MSSTTSKVRSGMVALVGRANVGKSSLMNAVLAEKVSIVSPVAQTTRNRVRGILHDPRGQLVLLDTPGLHKAESDLGRIMNRAGRAAVNGVDVAVLVFDASRPPQAEDEGWISYLCRPELADLHRVFVLNKADLGGAFADAYRACWARRRDSAAGTAAGATDPAPVPPRDPVWFVVSAATGDGVSALVDGLFALLPAGEPLFPENVLTDFPRKMFIADVVREKLFLRLKEELPHRVAVWIETVTEAGDGSWHAAGDIYVERSAQKGILIGHKGRFLRAVRRAAEAELANIYERTVTLELTIKVEPNWTRNHWFLQRLGYVD